MKTILVDDEYWALESFEQECSEEQGIEIVGKFMSSEEALAYAKENPVEFALLDIQMSGMDGMELARKLRELYPEIIVVFVTAHEEYLKDFIDMKADYYVLKPYTRQDVLDVIERARLLSGRLKKRVQIRTFGEFEVFIDGIPLYFSSRRAKELLALIVNKRGAYLSSGEAFSYIWGDHYYDNSTAGMYRKVLYRLDRILEENGISEILLSSIHGRALDVKKVDCDLLKLFDGDRTALAEFGGKYMAQYSWGEEALGEISRKARNLSKDKGPSQGSGFMEY